MENNEITKVEEIGNEVIEAEKAGLGFGQIAICVVGLAAVGFAAYKLGKKVVTNYKAKKEAENSIENKIIKLKDNEVEVVEK